MEYGELGILIDCSQSCVLQLPMSVIYGMLFTKYNLQHTKRHGQVFTYTANCICKQHNIDNTDGRKRSHVTITSVHLNEH